jgi:hypothetical protein
MAEPEAARTLLAECGVSLVVWCPGNRNPDRSLREHLKAWLPRWPAKTAPAWLQPVNALDGKLDIDRVVP